MPRDSPKSAKPARDRRRPDESGDATLAAGRSGDARAYNEEALGIFRELGDRVGEAIGLLYLGELSVQQGSGGARELFEQCLAIARTIEHQELESDCERNLGEIALEAGDFRAAQTRFARSLKVCRDAGRQAGRSARAVAPGTNRYGNGELDLSARRFSEALCALQAFEMNAEVLDCLEDVVELLQLLGEVENAVRMCAAVTAIREARALVRSPHRESEMQTRLKAARGARGSGLRCGVVDGASVDARRGDQARARPDDEVGRRGVTEWVWPYQCAGVAPDQRSIRQTKPVAWTGLRQRRWISSTCADASARGPSGRGQAVQAWQVPESERSTSRFLRAQVWFPPQLNDGAIEREGQRISVARKSLSLLTGCRLVTDTETPTEGARIDANGRSNARLGRGKFPKISQAIAKRDT